MYTYYVAPTSDDIYHHGILGQKWGKRNGPPYPLGGSAHSSSEKKAGWRKSLASDGRVAEAKVKKNNAKAIKKAANKQYSKDFNKYYHRSAQAFSPSRKQRRENEKRLRKAIDSAQVANEADKNYKIAKKEYKNAKVEAKIEKKMNSTLAGREKNASKIESKYDRKIEKAKNNNDLDKVKYLESKKEYKLKDFNDATPYIKSGYEQYKKNEMTFRKMKVSAIDDPSIKKTSAYKNAGKAYTKQKVYDNVYGSTDYIALLYAGDNIRKDGR